MINWLNFFMFLLIFCIRKGTEILKDLFSVDLGYQNKILRAIISLQQSLTTDNWGKYKGISIGGYKCKLKKRVK